MLEIIEHDGMHCCLSGVATLANAFGTDCVPAYWNLLSETAFAYEPTYGRYYSQRFYDNTALLGVETRTIYPASVTSRLPKEELSRREDILSALPDGEKIIIGMDAYFVPWSPSYRLFNTPHCFIAEKGGGDVFRCTDTTKKTSGHTLTLPYIALHSLSAVGVYQTAPKGLDIDDYAEAEDAKNAAKILRGGLLDRLDGCRSNKSGCAGLEALVQVIISNRKLYRYYLSRKNPELLRDRAYLSDSGLTRWEAVRHGLLKASVVWDNNPIINELADSLKIILDSEIKG